MKEIGPISISRDVNGAWYCSAIHAGYFRHMRYYGYTKREARALFITYLKGLS